MRVLLAGGGSAGHIEPALALADAVRRIDSGAEVTCLGTERGLATRLGARFTTHVFTGHPDTQLRNGKYIGIPIRREIADLDRLGLGDKARTHFGLRPDLPVLLVTGGSQGARSLNGAVFGAAGWLREAGVQVLHIIGPRNGHEAPVTEKGAGEVGGVPYVAMAYIDRM